MMLRPRLIPALLTPFDEAGKIDVEALSAHVDLLARSGVDAVMTGGTSGEGPLLDEEEIVRVAAVAVEAGRGRISVLAHVGRQTTDATVGLVAPVVDAGVEAVVAMVPPYYPLEQPQVLRHFRAFVRAAGATPAFAYVIPSHTTSDLSPRTFGALAAEGLAGVKDSTKSFDRHLEYLEAAPEGAQVYMGSDALVLHAFEAGAAGSVSAVANARPDLLVAIRDAFVDGRRDDAARAQEELARVREQLSSGPALAGIKRAASELLRGTGVDYPTFQRAPLG